MKRILVATDGSDGGDRAVAFAAELAKQFGAKLSIITVSGDFSDREIDKLAFSEKDIAGALDSRATRILIDARECAQHIGVNDIDTHSAWGDPAETIIETATRIRADAIDVGRRGRGQLAGLLLGSVSQKVATLAPCAVMVVP